MARGSPSAPAAASRSTLANTVIAVVALLVTASLLVSTDLWPHAAYYNNPRAAGDNEVFATVVVTGVPATEKTTGSPSQTIRGEPKLELVRQEDATPQTRGELVIFTHVHKAGGSTVCFLARYNGEEAGGGNCNPKDTELRTGLIVGNETHVNDTVDKIIDAKITFVANEWMLPEAFPERDDVIHMTMLRNPLARTESHYAMSIDQAHTKLSLPKSKWKCKFAPGLPTLKDIREASKDLEIAARTRLYFVQTTPDNWQTRVFCGPTCAEVPYGHLTPEHLALAKRRLENMYEIVGILEKFRESITMVHRRLQWQRNLEEDLEKHKGTTHGGLTVLQRVEQESAQRPHLLEFAKWFHATNQYDIELYNLARSIFKRHATAAGIQVDMGPDVEIDFVSPDGFVTPSSELKAMLKEYAADCKTQCCTEQCGPIGWYWYATAIKTHMVPPRSRWC